MLYGCAYYIQILCYLSILCSIFNFNFISFVFFLEYFTVLYGEYIINKIQINLLRGKIVWNTDYVILFSVLCVHTHTPRSTNVSCYICGNPKDNLWKLVLSFDCVGCGNWTQAIKLDTMRLYSPSHLTGPV